MQKGGSFVGQTNVIEKGSGFRLGLVVTQFCMKMRWRQLANYQLECKF